MPPVAAPAKPGAKPGGKPLPKWVWLVAIAGGLAVGFLLLKKSPAQGEGEGDESGAAGSGGEGGGVSPNVVAPLDEALGLKPPSEAGGFDVGYGGGSYSGGGDSGGGESFSSEGTGAQTLSSALQQYIQQQRAAVPTTSQVSQLPTRSVPTTSVASQIRGTITAPTAPSGGGGGTFFKAM